MTEPADDPDFGTLVDRALARFAERQTAILHPLGADLERFTAEAVAFVAGGKRLRPRFCHAGWLVAGGRPGDEHLATAAASLEWLQASALVHDDLMDGSDTRRGRPSVHRAFEALHRAEGRDGDAAGFGTSAAVLLGDLMLSWCDEMFTGAILDSPGLSSRLSAARRFLDLCKTEVVAGQLLDVAGQTRPRLSVDEAMTIVRFKAAKYTVERPLHIGAALAGASDDLLDGLSAVGLPLGEAFQLRDDVLGVFGDPTVTGKPAGDDLREGKRTVLVSRTYELTDDAGRDLLDRGLGTPDAVSELTALIETSGALAAVEADIARLEADTDDAIARLPGHAQDVLAPLARTATRRTR